MSPRSLLACCVVALCQPAVGQNLLRADGAVRIAEGATSQVLSDTLALCPLSQADVDLFLACVDALAIALPVDAMLAADLRARELPLASLAAAPVWALVDGGIDCRDFVCVLKKIAIALPLTSAPHARPPGYPTSNLVVVRSRMAEIHAALENLNNAVDAALEDDQ